MFSHLSDFVQLKHSFCYILFRSSFTNCDQRQTPISLMLSKVDWSTEFDAGQNVGETGPFSPPRRQQYVQTVGCVSPHRHNLMDRCACGIDQ